MGGKSSKSKSFDVTTPPAEGAEDKVTKEGNGIVECVNEAPVKLESEEASKPEENEIKEDAEKPKEVEKEKGKDKEKDKEKTKDKEKSSDEEKKKKKDKKRSFSFLSKKQKKNKEGPNGDVEGKVSTDESKNEGKEAEQAAAETSNTNDEKQIETTEEKTTEHSTAKEETATAENTSTEAEVKETTDDKENVQKIEASSTEAENAKMEQATEKEEKKEDKDEKAESPVAVAEVVETAEIKTVETVEASVQERVPETPSESSPDADSTTAQVESPVEEQDIQMSETKEEKIEEDTTAMQTDTSTDVIPPTVLPVPEISSSTVDSEIASPESVVNMNICDDKQVEEASPLSSQQNIPEIPPENTDEIMTSVITTDDNQTNAISSPIPQSPSPVIESTQEVESPVELNSPVENEVLTNELVSEQAVLNSGTDLSCETGIPEPVENVETVKENISLDLNQLPTDNAEPMLISPEEPVITSEPVNEVDNLVDEQLVQDTNPSKSLAEPAVIVQAAIPDESVSDENMDLISSLPTPPNMIDPSSPELSEKSPSPPPENDLDIPGPIENSCQDSDGLPSPDEIPEQLVQTKKTSLVSTKITWEHGGKEVAMTGSFMDWVDSLQLIESDGIFSVAVELPEGEHYCKFLVDGTWTVNSAQPIHELDGQGQVNTILVKVGGNEE